MKKIVIVVVVLVALLALGPLAIGNLAEKRIDHGLAKLTEVAPYLKVVESKYTKGWFKSEQVVTFEAFGPWMQALNEAMKKEGVSVDGAPESDAVEPAAPEAAAPESDAPATSEESAADPAVAESSEAEPAPVAVPPSPLRFTVRNEILHGPVLGFSGLGIARVKSHLVLSDEIRKEIAEIFGPKDPVEISTRVGFLGGGTTTLKSEGRTIKPAKGKTEVSWETFKVAIGYSRNADSFDLDGKWPKLDVKNTEDNSRFVMTDMTLDGEGKRISGDLYGGDFRLGIDKMSAAEKNSEPFELNDLEIIEIIDAKGDFTGISIKMGSGEVKVKELASLGVALKEVHYDVGVRHLHTATLAKIATDMKALYAKPLLNVAALDEVMFGALKESGAELLKYDPEFVIDRIGIVTADGDGYIKGLVTLKGATAEDFGAGSTALIGKIHADITVDVSEKMLQKMPNGSTGAGAAVDAGYAKREGDRLICKILFSKGQLTVNGKPQAIPGLGGPPPAEGEEAPPPQE